MGSNLGNAVPFSKLSVFGLRARDCSSKNCACAVDFTIKFAAHVSTTSFDYEQSQCPRPAGVWVSCAGLH